jgi:hypothetical protein
MNTLCEFVGSTLHNGQVMKACAATLRAFKSAGLEVKYKAIMLETLKFTVPTIPSCPCEHLLKEPKQTQRLLALLFVPMTGCKSVKHQGETEKPALKKQRVLPTPSRASSLETVTEKPPLNVDLMWSVIDSISEDVKNSPVKELAPAVISEATCTLLLFAFNGGEAHVLPADDKSKKNKAFNAETGLIKFSSYAKLRAYLELYMRMKLKLPMIAVLDASNAGDADADDEAATGEESATNHEAIVSDELGSLLVTVKDSTWHRQLAQPSSAS